MFEREIRGAHPVMSVLDVVDDVLDKAATLDAWSLSDDDLGEAMRRCEALAARQAALGLRLLCEADARDLGRRQGASSTTAWLRDTLRLRPGVAKARVELANRLDATDAAPTDFAVNVEAGRRRQATMPVTAQALATGAVSVDHATVIARTLAELPTDLDPDETSRAESDLAGFARVHDPATLTRLGAHLVHVLSAESLDDREQRAVRARRLTFTDLGDGSVRLSGRLDTEGAAAVRTALDPLAAPRPATNGERDPRRPDRRLADALVELASRHLDAGELPTGHGIRPHLVLTASVETLLGRAAGAVTFAAAVNPSCDHSPDHVAAGHDPGDHHASDRDTSTPARTSVRARGPKPVRWIQDTWARRFGIAPAELEWSGPISSEALRRHACDASVTTVLLGDTSVPLRVGRAERTVPVGIWIGLLARDRGCTFPGCTRPSAWCHAHHIEHWADGGPTDIENLVLLCAHHHRVVHHRGWDVRLAADGHPEFLPPPWIDLDRRPRRNNRPRHDQLASPPAGQADDPSPPMAA